MVRIGYRNLGISPDTGNFKEKLEKISKLSAPSFESSKADISYITGKSKKYKRYKNVILVANGGSRTSALAFYGSLANFRNKVNFEFVTSSEPDIINNIRKKYSKKDTLVLVISKSGSNINSIEPLLALIDYPVLAIAGEGENTLSQIAKKRNWDVVIHPEVEGRYSGMTTCGLVPAYLMGLDIEKIYAGAENGYKKYSAKNNIEKNDALKLAAYLYNLEKKGYVEIFSSVYSSLLASFLPLIIQLVHEGTGKEGKGQTIFGELGPETHHHTTQRILGGRKNVAGIFIKLDDVFKDYKIKIPANIKDILFRNCPLQKLEWISAKEAIKIDMQGVFEHAKKLKIPVAEMAIDGISEESMGEFMVFWHYFAMYSALLRGQDPFNQPEVEASKLISLDLRMKKK